MIALCAMAWPELCIGTLCGAATALAFAWFWTRATPAARRHAVTSFPLAAELLDEAPALIVVVNGEGRIVFINRAAADMAGESPERLRGQDGVARFVPPEEQAEYRDRLRRAALLSTPELYAGGVVLPDGSRRQIGWRYGAWRDARGQLLGLVGVGNDITELRRAHDEAVQSQRLVAIGQMMAGLAHESRNYLQRSQACLEMLTSQLAGHPEWLDLVYRIQIALDQLHRLYEDVRRYAAPVVLKVKPVDLRDALRDAWDQLEPLWSDRDVAFDWEPKDAPWSCHADPHGMQSVFRNILENALSACSDPMELRVVCRPEPADGRPALEITLADNGPGLSPEIQRRIFEPFFTTKTQGTGLGLSIVRRIVESHGGRITAASGTTGAQFTIVLPTDR